MASFFQNVPVTGLSQNTMNVDQPAIKKTKRDDVPGKMQGKRAALGTISSNISTRRQPSRAAKQVSVKPL